MGGNTTWEIEIGSERGLYKYINQEGTTKASTIIRMILVQMYNKLKVPDYSSTESYGNEFPSSQSITPSKVQKNTDKIKKTQTKSQHLREKYDTGP